MSSCCASVILIIAFSSLFGYVSTLLKYFSKPIEMKEKDVTSCLK